MANHEIKAFCSPGSFVAVCGMELKLLYHLKFRTLQDIFLAGLYRKILRMLSDLHLVFFWLGGFSVYYWRVWKAAWKRKSCLSAPQACFVEWLSISRSLSEEGIISLKISSVLYPCFARLFLKMSTSVLKYSLENVPVFLKKLRFASLEQTSSVIKETDVNQDAIFILVVLLNRFITRYLKEEANLGLVVHFLSQNS